MKESDSRITRRSLLKAGAALAVGSGAPLATVASQEDEPWRSLQGASASVLTDALGRAGYDPRKQVMSTDINPVTKGDQTIVGPAVTTKWETAHAGYEPDAVTRFVFQPLDEAPAGSIWVVASGIDHLYSMFGELIVMACARNGMVGAVTDGGCRDITGTDELNFPVFAKGTVLHGPGNVIRPVGANVDVVCGGVPVRPGDVIAADVDGVLVIPKEAVPEVARFKQELLEEEIEVRRRIENGVPLASAYSYR